MSLDLTKFNFPEVTKSDMTFSTFNTNKELLQEAIERGFLHGRTPYNQLFRTLFFSGGTVKFKEGIDADFKLKAWNYCRCLMGSFAPKHEHKEAVCAMLLSELVEPELSKEA